LRPILAHGLQIDQSKGLNRFCIDQNFLNALIRPLNTEWEQKFLEYILVTGANWSGPIKRFRLVVDKGSPANLVSFCGRGVRKISPTQFEMSASEFTPKSNLSVLILTPRTESVDAGGTTGSIGPQEIFALNCDQLWFRRNSIFKAAGYCFHMPRAIRVFGNSGCATTASTTCLYLIETGGSSTHFDKRSV